MADNYIDFSIRMKDEASTVVKTVGVNMEHLRKGVRQVTEEVTKTQRSIVDWAQAAQAADLLGQSVTQLYGVCKDLTAAYQVQLVAETQLQTVMRQRMSATEEEIQSIKDLASAQQELGVIGDEVQLSGAQQMATFLNEKASLESLIPAMNNLLAQQKGLNATNQDAVSIGNMMGKAMQGQVDVLQRVGVTFTDAQKSVLQYGTESERAAMLAQVIRDNVGDMNAELARTDAGKQKQLENTLGDIKEKMGSLVQGAMPFLTIAAAATTATTGAIRLYSSLRSVTAALKGTTAATSLAAIHTRIQAQAMKLLSATNVTATVSTRALRVATIALYATYTGGLYLAVEGLISLFSNLGQQADETAGKQNLLKDSIDAYKNSVSQIKGELDMEISSLASLIRSHGDATEKVDELNRKYGEALGYHKTAAEWYDVLIRKSADYCKAIGYEAQAKVLASQKAAKELELENIRKQKQVMEENGTNQKSYRYLTHDSKGQISIGIGHVDTKEYKKLTEQERGLTKETTQLQGQFDTCMTKMQEGLSSLKIESGTTELAAMSYDELGKEIEKTEKALKGLAPTETAEVDRLTEYNKQLKVRKEAMGEMLGLEKGSGKGKGTEKDTEFVKGSIHAMKNELAKYEKELSGKPVGTASIDLQIKIDNLKNQIEGVKIWIEKEVFKDTHGEIKVDVIPFSNAGRDLGQMAEDFQDERSKKNPDSEQNTLTHDSIKKMKLPQIEMPKIDPKKSGFEKWNEAVDTAYKKNQDLIEGMSGIGSVMGSLGQAVGGAAGEWLNWGANVVQAVAAAIPQITSLLGLQSTQVAANTAVAGSGAAASTASIPIVGPILAVAAVASVLAALANLPKFASGAIAYGPTLGIFGEYAGATNNPEVVAPLNKLRNLIQPTGGMGGVVEFRIDGRMLRGVLNKVDRYNQRTR